MRILARASVLYIAANLLFINSVGAFIKPMSRPEDLLLVAKVIAGEAADQGYNGMLAVANVIRNRMLSRKQSAIQVVTAKYQFEALTMPAMMNRNYRDVSEIVDKLAAGIENLEDNTGGATSYVTVKYYESHKHNHNNWVSKMKVTKVIGGHVFMKEA